MFSSSVLHMETLAAVGFFALDNLTFVRLHSHARHNIFFTPLCHLHLTHWPCVESLLCLLWPQLQHHTWRSLYNLPWCHRGRTAKPICGKTGALEKKRQTLRYLCCCIKTDAESVRHWSFTWLGINCSNIQFKCPNQCSASQEIFRVDYLKVGAGN